MNCTNCGNKLTEDAKFCSACGTKVMKATNHVNKVIHTARVTLVMFGYGDITLTPSALIWNKAATTYLAFGVMGALSDGHILIPIENITNVGTYTYIPGGGMTLLLKDGKQYKVAFKHKKDFNIVYEYLRDQITSRSEEW